MRRTKPFWGELKGTQSTALVLNPFEGEVLKHGWEVVRHGFTGLAMVQETKLDDLGESTVVYNSGCTWGSPGAF